jgi:general secretion pathway protein C
MKRRLPLLVSFLLFIALCAAIAYWALQMFKPPVRPVAAPPREIRPEPSMDAASGLFGGRAAKTAVASNYQLRGIIVAGPRDSVAIISADGKPAMAVRVGAELAPGVTIKAVNRDHVLVTENGAEKRVELPESAKGLPDIATAPPVTSRPMPPPPPANPTPAIPTQPTARSSTMPSGSALSQTAPTNPGSALQQRTPPPSPAPVSPTANQPVPQVQPQPQSVPQPTQQPTQQPLVPQTQTAPPNVGVSLPPGNVPSGLGVSPSVNTAVPAPAPGMQQAVPSQ